MNTSPTNPTDPTETRPWTLCRAILSLGFQPRALANNVQHIPLWHAILTGILSFVAGGLALIAILFLQFQLSPDLQCYRKFSWYSSLSSDEKADLAYSILIPSIFTHPVFLFYLGYCVLFALMILAIAIEVSFHDIRNFPKDQKFSHSIRVCSLQAVQIPILLTLACGIIPWRYVASFQYGKPPTPPTVPALAPGEDPALSPIRQQYLQERETYLRKKDCYSALSMVNSPYTHEEQRFILIVFYYFITLFWLIMLSRAFDTRKRRYMKFNREGHPICLECKYDLHGQSRTGHCPECGTPINQSISRRYRHKQT